MSLISYIKELLTNRTAHMIIGLDVGGTHTDVVLLGKEGLLKEVKVNTDHENLFETVLEGLEKITENINSKEISRAVLSTTLATNAVVQNKLPDVGMIVCGGPGIDPELFRTNPDYICVSGSVDHRGREVSPIVPSEIEKAKNAFAARNIRNIGIVGKFSVRNPGHEQAIFEILKNDFDKIFLGHRISGNLNFPRRIATTYLNAAVHQVHQDFFSAVKRSLEKKGLHLPIHILKADGGTMSLESSLDHPSQTIISGPAASVMGSIAFASDDDDCIVMDIGGTTTDMAVLVKNAPVLEPIGIRLGRYQTHIRSIHTHSIGIGGDSHVRVSEDGGLLVGPERKGRAMAYGGPEPTPTDALFVLGKIKEGDKEKARAGIQKIADALGKDLVVTASLIFDTAIKHILEEAEAFVDFINSRPVYTVHEYKEGYKVAPNNIVVLGGPAVYFGRRIEEISRYKVGIVPKWTVANAIGSALARTTSEVTLFADTERKIVRAPEENFQAQVTQTYSKRDAIKKAKDLLTKKAILLGATPDDLETEVVEELEFNMVRGFYTTGKNIRVKMQIKPGLIQGYDPIGGRL